jgi:hypothetical protein
MQLKLAKSNRLGYTSMSKTPYTGSTTEQSNTALYPAGEVASNDVLSAALPSGFDSLHPAITIIVSSIDTAHVRTNITSRKPT